MTIVDGKTIWRDGAHPDLDVAALSAEVAAAVRRHAGAGDGA
jgi:hypothetical protein